MGEPAACFKNGGDRHHQKFGFLKCDCFQRIYLLHDLHNWNVQTLQRLLEFEATMPPERMARALVLNEVKMMSAVKK